MRAGPPDRGARAGLTALILLLFLIGLGASGQAATRDTKALEDVVAARARLDRLTIHGFQYQLREGTRLGTYRLYTLADRGLPRRVEAFSAQGRQDVTADYFDYDAPLTIALPSCG